MRNNINVKIIKKFILAMAKLMLNKGFTMIELLIAICIMGLFSNLTFANKNDLSYKQETQIYNLSNNLVNSQITSLINRSQNCFEQKRLKNRFPICYNSNGNINISQNLELLNNDYYITIYLGAGTHEIKKR